MGDSIDFFKLYAALGLRPGFTLEEFKRAYRRQVAALHPDQANAARESAADARGALLELQELNRLYDAAMDFHRSHGRMPGELVSRVNVAAQRASASASASVRRTTVTLPPANAAPVAEKPFRLRYVLLIAVMVAVVYAIERDELPTLDVPDRVLMPMEADASADTADHALLSLGMSVDEVLEIQGAPLNTHEQRLDYGPSWVALRCGRVSDWYSSPLRPLHVETSAPTAAARALVDETMPAHC